MILTRAVAGGVVGGRFNGGLDMTAHELLRNFKAKEIAHREFVHAGIFRIHRWFEDARNQDDRFKMMLADGWRISKEKDCWVKDGVELR